MSMLFTLMIDDRTNWTFASIISFVHPGSTGLPYFSAFLGICSNRLELLTFHHSNTVSRALVINYFGVVEHFDLSAEGIVVSFSRLSVLDYVFAGMVSPVESLVDSLFVGLPELLLFVVLSDFGSFKFLGGLVESLPVEGQVTLHVVKS